MRGSVAASRLEELAAAFHDPDTNRVFSKLLLCSKDRKSVLALGGKTLIPTLCFPQNTGEGAEIREAAEISVGPREKLLAAR